MHTPPFRTLLSCAAGAALLCMLGFYSFLAAAPPGKPPFEDAGTQRLEMIRELQAIKELIREQNALLKEVMAPPHARDKAKR